MTSSERQLSFKTTRVFAETLTAWLGGSRRCLHEGGTSSSKTWSILQALLLIARNARSPLLLSVVSESLPHLKRGCIRDLFHILDESPDNNPRWSKTEFVYTCGNGRIEFFGADDSDKVRGPRRDILFINEGNNVPWETARGLDIRTAKFTIVDWNPVGEFWAHQNWLAEPGTHYCHSTFLDARDVLPDEVVANIESNRDKDPNWWNIYGLGLVGKVEGLVYPAFQQVDALPLGAVFYGLDFGFSDDPTVLVKNVLVGDRLYSQELIYERGMTNDQIARRMDLLGVHPRDPILADAAEPKSIEEIRLKHFNIMPGEKGPGSVDYGIQKVNQCFQFWTRDSVNCIREQRNFRYLLDRVNGRLTDRTAHLYSHGMDARRYALAGYRPRRPAGRITYGA